MRTIKLRVERKYVRVNYFGRGLACDLINAHLLFILCNDKHNCECHPKDFSQEEVSFNTALRSTIRVQTCLLVQE